MRETELLARFSILILFLNYFAFAQSYPDKEIDSYIRQITERISSENYLSADSLIQAFKSDYPTSSFPYIYDVANIITRDFNCNLKLDNKRIYVNLSIADDIADSLLQVDSLDIWTNYQKGIVDGYRAYFEALKGNYFSAYDYGNNSLSYFSKCLFIDSSFADALIAEGTYDYWIAEKLGWLPFVPDKREHAIKIIYDGIRRNSYHRELGVSSLFWILKNEKKYKEAKTLIKEEYKKYPTNRYIITAFANIEKEFNKLHSVQLYGKALIITLKCKERNRINEIILRHKIAMLDAELGRKNEAIYECKRILKIKNLSNWEKEKLEDRLEKVRELYLQLKGKHQE